MHLRGCPPRLPLPSDSGALVDQLTSYSSPRLRAWIREMLDFGIG
jgi:hypothetical protein